MQHTQSDKNAETTSRAIGRQGTEGVSMPSVPVLQQKDIEEKSTLQLVSSPIQHPGDEDSRQPVQAKFIVQNSKEKNELPASLQRFSLSQQHIPLQTTKVDDKRQLKPFQLKSNIIQSVSNEATAFETSKFIAQQKGESTENSLQLKPFVPPVQRKENKTGLPANLKSGIENLSGFNMDDVKVHYNSVKPATLQAHAYAQGTEIHVSTGQEKHLPHEAWHVVQQKQGRVVPTIQMKGGVAVNDDKELEQEADTMGVKALQMNYINPLQLQPFHYHQNVVQQVSDNGGDGSSENIDFGKLYQSTTDHKEGAFAGKTPVVIEVNEMTVESAKAKIDGYANGTVKNKIPVAFVIGINQKKTKKIKQPSELDAMAQEIAGYLESKNLEGGCFSFSWKPSGDEGGYTFPFLEARSLLTLHEGVDKIHTRMNELTGSDPIIRGMDGDVTSDPLLSQTPMSPYAEDALESGLNSLSEGTVQIISGGYIWDPEGVKSRLNALNLVANDTIVGDIKTMITLLNKYELLVRSKLAETYTARSVYWPEPNTYMDLATRKSGANAMKNDTAVKTGKSQQKESTHYVKAASIKTGDFNPDLAVVKPMKTYLDDLLKVLHTKFNKKVDPTADIIEVGIKTVRQTHLNPAAIDDNYNWTDQKMKFDSIAPAKEIVVKYLNKCSADIVSMMIDIIAQR